MSSHSETLNDTQQRMQLLLRRWGLGIFALVLTVGIFLILAFNLVRGPQVSVTLGLPAPQDVVAPRSMTYVSEVLTDKAKQQAAASVTDQYTQLDLTIARAQNNAVRSVFSFIEQVRADSMASKEIKLGYLQAVEGISIEEQTADDLLALSQSEYMATRDNILGIVEDTMRAGVVEERLSDAKRDASLGAAFDLTPSQERVVRSLAPQFIVPNIFFDEVSTAELQQEAMSSVEPVTTIVTRDETVIRVGDIIQDEDLEMLEQMGLLRQETDWQRAISAFLASLLAVTIITIYWNLYFGDKPNSVRSLVILGTLILLFVLGAKLLMPSGSIFVYLYPAATLTILTAVVFEARLAIVITLAVAGLVGYIAQFSLEMATYAVAGGILAVLTLSDTQRINALFRAGLVAAVGNVAVIVIFRVPQDIAPSELLTLVLLGVVNGPLIAAALSLAGLFIIGSGFRVTTSLQLQDLSRLDHPLLQELLRRAPGTYHHSIMVANLAEQAAEKVKANSTLVRVGAFYHDVGKINRPPFFIENQNGGNPHDNLDPYSSARIIISHVHDGIELARRYRLPNRIRDFIAEHHGDRVLKVFYQKALDAADAEEEVDISRFRYKGPRPGSRESGIVQLADTVEATSSALRPSTEEEIEKLVTGIVDDHLKEGQLDNSGLTLGDIKTIKESFIETVKGRFHVRVKYPGNEKLEVSAESQEGENDSAPIDGTGGSEQDGAVGLVSQNNLLLTQPDPIPTGEAITAIEELDEPVRN